MKPCNSLPNFAYNRRGWDTTRWLSSPDDRL